VRYKKDERYPHPGLLPEKGWGNELQISFGEEPLLFSGRGWSGYLKASYRKEQYTAQFINA
jgi:hypothetical protein